MPPPRAACRPAVASPRSVSRWRTSLVVDFLMASIVARERPADPTMSRPSPARRRTPSPSRALRAPTSRSGVARNRRHGLLARISRTRSVVWRLGHGIINDRGWPFTTPPYLCADHLAKIATRILAVTSEISGDAELAVTGIETAPDLLFDEHAVGGGRDHSVTALRWRECRWLHASRSDSVIDMPRAIAEPEPGDHARHRTTPRAWRTRRRSAWTAGSAGSHHLPSTYAAVRAANR